MAYLFKNNFFGSIKKCRICDIFKQLLKLTDILEHARMITIIEKRKQN